MALQHIAIAIIPSSLISTSSITLPLSLPKRRSRFFCRVSLKAFPTLTMTIHKAINANMDVLLHVQHGPSLGGGEKTEGTIGVEEQVENNFLDKDSFTRVYAVAALRVAAHECHPLENSLRGHLLNWPRIKNIARVPGDDLDDTLEPLLPIQNPKPSKEDDDVHSYAHRSDTMFLQRAKVAQELEQKVSLEFRRLNKISRPKNTNISKPFVKGGDEKVGVAEKMAKSKSWNKKNDVAIEVVEDNEQEDMRGLLGDDFGVSAWRGPTRLLVLDPRYARKPASQLPQAIQVPASNLLPCFGPSPVGKRFDRRFRFPHLWFQVLLKRDENQNKKSKAELVQCNITLFYDYWLTHEVLCELLPKGMSIPSSYETVGHIAHLNLNYEHLPYRRLIAQVIFDKNRPKIQTVVNKIDAIQNEFRTMKLEVLAGNHSLVTSLVENGIRFHVDLATVYWNSRLSGERQRLLNSFTRTDNVCDVFCGAGPITIIAAKEVNRVYANDLNPEAVKYLSKNVTLNNLQKRIEIYNMDGRDFIREIFGRNKPAYVTHVVMNLPTDAAEFLDAFRGVLKRKFKDTRLQLPKIHVYGFSKATTAEEEFLARITHNLGEAPSDANVRRVRLVAPGKWMLCATFTLPVAVAYS